MVYSFHMMFFNQRYYIQASRNIMYMFSKFSVEPFKGVATAVVSAMAVKVDLHSTTLSHAICLQQVYNTSCFV